MLLAGFQYQMQNKITPGPHMNFFSGTQFVLFVQLPCQQDLSVPHGHLFFGIQISKKCHHEGVSKRVGPIRREMDDRGLP